jgi:phage terminase small subunit
MNHRNSLFISEYITSGNATEAALKAGYSKKTAYSSGQRLLKNVEIMTEIKKHQKTASNQAEISLIQIVKEIRQISLNADDNRIKLKAYDMLMKHLGGYVSDFALIQKLDESDLERLADKLISRLQ